MQKSRTGFPCTVLLGLPPIGPYPLLVKVKYKIKKANLLVNLSTHLLVNFDKKIATLDDGGSGNNDAGVDGGCVLRGGVSYYCHTRCL